MQLHPSPSLLANELSNLQFVDEAAVECLKWLKGT